MLRLPSVFAGTAFCWFFYKWMAMVFGRAASWIGLILTAFSPAISRSLGRGPRLRPPAVLHQWRVVFPGALLNLEVGSRHVVLQRLSLFGHLSHYSAVFFAAAAGVYTLARIADSLFRAAAWPGRPGKRARWHYAFLYVTHVSKIKQTNGSLEESVRKEFLPLRQRASSAFYAGADFGYFRIPVRK